MQKRKRAKPDPNTFAKRMSRLLVFARICSVALPLLGAVAFAALDVYRTQQ